MTIAMIRFADAIQFSSLYSKGNEGQALLESYYRLELTNSWSKVKSSMSEYKLSLFLDSGAFSAWAKGISINLDEYIAFCKQYLDCLDLIANLDVIAGRPGVPATAAQFEEAAKQSWANYQTMLAAGIPKDKLIPAFHIGEDWAWLDKYLEVTNYIALGGVARVKEEARLLWMDQCWTKLTDERGMPKVKVHGFGITSFDVMKRYPWFSVDSTSWVVASRFGSILVPPYRNGQYDFSVIPFKVFVSEKSPAKKEEGQHYDSYSPEEKKLIDGWLAQLGFTTQEAQTDYMVRDQINIIYFKKLEAAMPIWPWSWKGRERHRQKMFF